MAIMQLQITNKSGCAIIAAAAYRAGEKMTEDKTGIIYDYTRKRGIVFSEIMLPPNAPEEYYDRSTLWNAVDKVESRCDAYLAREIEVALPRELSRSQQIELLERYIQKTFVDAGMCADFSVHDKKDGNPHCHILLTTRSIDQQGKWCPKSKTEYLRDSNGNRIPDIDPITGLQKIRVREGNGSEKMWKRETIPFNNWNDHSMAEIWRAGWAKACNEYLDRDHQIDHRSYERQGIDRIPTIHEGKTARKIEKAGYHSIRVSINNYANEINEIISERILLLQQMEVLIKKREKEVSAIEWMGLSRERDQYCDSMEHCPAERKQPTITGTSFSSTGEKESCSRQESRFEKTTCITNDHKKARNSSERNGFNNYEAVIASAENELTAGASYKRKQEIEDEREERSR